MENKEAFDIIITEYKNSDILLAAAAAEEEKSKFRIKEK